MTQAADDRTRDQRDLAHVIELLNVKLERGQVIDIESIVNEHPQHAAQLQDLMPAMVALMDLSTPTGRNNGRVSPSVSDGACELRRLGDFRIGREIGRGGMGVVYEAEQVSLGRKVALKVLPFAAVLDKKCLQRFQTEARVAATLDHPNIVSIFSVGCENAVYFYSMQLIEGQSLAEAIAQLKLDREDGKNGVSLSKGQQDLPDAQTSPLAMLSTRTSNGNRAIYRTVARLGIHVAEALHYAHDLGIVHRDIKPSNLLLDADGKIWVADFGLAMIQEDADLTRTGDLVGTLRYMSPEAASGNRAVVNHLTDVYSLGATLYELLALQPAHQANTHHELLQQITVDEPTPLRRINGAIPVELETIVQKAMSKDLHLRYASAQELADDLRAHLDNRPIKAKPLTVSETIGKWTRRNPTITWAAFITLSLITITLSVSIFFISREWKISELRRVRAVMAEREAKKARDESTTRANELARRNYLLHIANADRALLGKDKDYIRAQAELDICQNDQRGWEWEYLDQRIRDNIPLSFRGTSEHFTRDGRRLIAIKVSDTWENNQVISWNLETGGDQEILRHDSQLQKICVSNDEQWIAGGDRDGYVIVWDGTSGKERWRVDTRDETGNPNRVNDIEFSPKGRFIASTYNDRRLLVVFDGTNGEEWFTLGPFEDAPAGVSFSPDGRWLATATGNGAGPALLIDVAARKVADRFSEKGDMRPIFHPSGQRIATANVDGSIHIWSWDGKKLDKITSRPAVDRRIFNPADRQIYNIAFSSDGTLLASTDRSNQVKVWNATTGELLARLKSRDAVYDLQFRSSADGQDEQIMIGSKTIGIRFWRWRSDEGGKTVKALDGAVEAKFSPDRKFILASTPMYFTGGNLHYHRHPYYPPESAAILNAETGAKILAIDEAIYAASWSPDGKEIIATPASGDAIRTYDVETGHPTSRRFPGHTGRYAISRFSSSRDCLVSFSTDHTLRVFEYKSGEIILERRLRSEAVFHGTAADFSHDADLLAAMGPGIYDTRREAQFKLQLASGHWVKRTVFSNDRNRVYCGCSGGLLVQFDIASGKELKRFVGHSGYVRAIAISPDERHIVAGDTFGQAIVWDVASEQPLVTLTAGDRIVTSLDWSSDGRQIVAGKEDGTVQIWTLPRLPTGSSDRDTDG